MLYLSLKAWGKQLLYLSLRACREAIAVSKPEDAQRNPLLYLSHMARREAIAVPQLEEVFPWQSKDLRGIVKRKYLTAYIIYIEALTCFIYQKYPKEQL